MGAEPPSMESAILYHSVTAVAENGQKFLHLCTSVALKYNQ